MSQDLAETYLRFLLSKHEYAKAAALCPRLLGEEEHTETERHRERESVRDDRERESERR